MIKQSLKSIATPIIALVLCSILYLSGYFQVIFAAPIILVASWIEYGKGTFTSLGFRRSNLKAVPLLVVAPLMAGMMFLLYWYVLIPGITYLTGQAMDFSFFEPYKGNLKAILSILPFVWISAAFGEEILFRGYLMRQFTKFFGSSSISLIINIIIIAVIFGWIHSYQGLSGQIVTGIIGAMLAAVFHLRKSDLWFNVAIHGFFDTIALALIYYS